MTSRKLILLTVALLLAGWLAGGGNVIVAAQVHADQEQSSAGPWRMFGGNVAGTGGSGGGGGSNNIPGSPGSTGWAVERSAWMYNTETGKTYRVFDDCGDDGVNGCLLALPVLGANGLSEDLPGPQGLDGNVMAR